MNFRLLLFILVIALTVNLLQARPSRPGLSLSVDSLVDQSFMSADEMDQVLDNISKPASDSIVFPADYSVYYPDFDKIRKEMVVQYVDESLLTGNSLLIDLVFKGYIYPFEWKSDYTIGQGYFGRKATTLSGSLLRDIKPSTPESNIENLRKETARYLANHEPELFVFRKDELKKVDDLIDQKVENKPLEKIKFIDDKVKTNDNKLVIANVKRDPWTKKANALFQFSQNYITPNWYQGGNNNAAILGILNGQLNFDDKKNVQFENNFEWRTGFNTVNGDTLRLFNTNDDVLRVNSKLGIKAGGNWFYTGTVDFSTQFFNSYRAINSNVLKASFLTPVRLNVGVGLDFKYKKLFSVMLSPISFKYIYVDDTIRVDRRSFGINKGTNELKQIGSSFRAQTSFSPMENVQMDSRLIFYTNYEKVEIDWEIVTNFTVNRFMSARLSLNPRFDNTMIMNPGEKAKLQFKELLTFGLSYRLIN